MSFDSSLVSLRTLEDTDLAWNSGLDYVFGPVNVRALRFTHPLSQAETILAVWESRVVIAGPIRLIIAQLTIF